MFLRKFLSLTLVLLIAIMALPVNCFADRLSDAVAEMNAALSSIVQIDSEIAQGDARAHQITLELQANSSNISPEAIQRSINLTNETLSLASRKTTLLSEKDNLQARVRALDAEIQSLKQQQPQPGYNQNPQPGYQQPQPAQNEQPEPTGMVSAVINGSSVLFGEGFAEINMNVLNTGSVQATFQAAVTIRDQNGIEINPPQQSVTLFPGCSASVQWKPDLFPGNYDYILGVWYDGMPLANNGWGNLTVYEAKKPQPALQLNRLIIARFHYEWQYNGEKFNMRVENLDSIPWNFFGALTIRKPNGEEINLDRQSVYVLPGDTSSRLYWNFSPDIPGRYDFIFGLWQDDDTPLVDSGWLNFTIERTEDIPVSTIQPSYNPTPQSEQKREPAFDIGILSGWWANCAYAGESFDIHRTFRNNGNSSQLFIAALTICSERGLQTDLARQWVYLDPGQETTVWWNDPVPADIESGNYDLIFGVWKDNDTPYSNSGWNADAITVYGENPVVQDSKGDDVDNLWENSKSLIQDEDKSEEGEEDIAESLERIREKYYCVPSKDRYVSFSPNTHFLYDFKPAVSNVPVIVPKKTKGSIVSVNGHGYYPIDSINSLGGSVSWEGNYIRVYLDGNEALVDLENQTVIVSDGIYSIDPMFWEEGYAITDESISFPYGFYRAFLGISPMMMSIPEEENAYAEEYGNAIDKGPELIRDTVICALTGYVVGEVVAVFVPKITSYFSTRISLFSAVSGTRSMIYEQVENKAVLSAAKKVISWLPKTNLDDQAEKRLLAKLSSNLADTERKKIIGELNALRAVRRSGMSIHPDFNQMHHGFDWVMKQGDDLAIVEAKFVSAERKVSLSDFGMVDNFRQGSKGWIRYAAGLIDNSGKKYLAEEIGNKIQFLKRILVVTRPSGTAYGVTDSVKDLFDVIIEVSSNGSQLAKYVN